MDNSSGALLVDSDVLASQLQACYTRKDVRKLHASVLKYLTSSVTFVDNTLISSYARFGDLVEARKVFDKMLERNVVSWTAILNGYLRLGLDDEALWLFREFIGSGVQANCKTFVCVLNLCSQRLDYELGQQIHACIIKGKYSNLVVDSAIVYFYARCGDLLGAVSVFDRMPTHDVVSWTSIITACSQLGWGDEAILLFSQMLLEGFSPNEFTVCSVLNACGDEAALKLGRQLHVTIVKKIYKSDVFIETSLVDMYAKCGEIADSRKVFDEMRKRNMVTWTSIIAGYARNGLGENAISLFRIMKRRNIYANNLTMVSILRACGLVGGLRLGKEVHAQLIKNSAQINIYLGSTLVWLYCKCSEYSTASKVLQEMSFRDVFSWTAMISGCAGLGHEPEALEFLKEMLGEGVKPNSFTYSSALKACARLQNIQHGRLIHSFVNKTPSFSNVYVGSALIFMYSKCGHVSEAIQVFDSMPERNLVSWKAMIVGYAKNGFHREALKLMYRMQAEGIEVDDYIIATVLTACGDIDRNMEHSPEYCLQSA
ncbi:Pentatricopeptide repeat-containing protein, chloroplastic [Sarracenia purpurea var. burkii]